MKKITLLIALMVYSLGFSQTPEGTWKLSDPDGLAVGPAKGSGEWFHSDAALVAERPCQWDDEFVFNADGSFQNVLQAATYLEGWQLNPAACAAPLAPHDGSNPATWVYSASNNTIVLDGLGAFLGLPKSVNAGELPGVPVPTTRTYTVTALTDSNMTLDIECGTGVWWRFNFTKKQAGQPVIEPLVLSPATVGDPPIEIVDPLSDSPGSFSYSSSDPLVATVSGNFITVVGPGATEITATQAAAAPFVSGLVKAQLLVHDIAPTTAAPTQPVRNSGDVISIFSGAYTDLAGTEICKCWGQSTIVDEVDPGNGDVFKRMEFFTYQGVVMAGTHDLSGGMWKLHIDMLNKDLKAMKVVLISSGQGNETPYTLTPTVVGWNSFDIDVNTTNYPAPVALNDIIQIKLDAVNGPTTTYFDNLYFYKAALGVAKFDASGVKMYPNPVKNTLTIDANSAINRVSVYNVLGQEVMKVSPKSNTVTLQTNELQKGVYMVTTEIDGKTSTSKVVKE
jgi:hypothetical protein